MITFPRFVLLALALAAIATGTGSGLAQSVASEKVYLSSHGAEDAGAWDCKLEQGHGFNAAIAGTAFPRLGVAQGNLPIR